MEESMLIQGREITLADITSIGRLMNATTIGSIVTYAGKLVCQLLTSDLILV